MAKKSTQKKTTAASAKKSVAPKVKKIANSAKPAAKPAPKPASRPAVRPAVRPVLRRLEAARAAAPIVIKKVKCPLTKSELDEFRQMLLEKRRALVGDMNGIEAEALRTNRQEGTGDLSNMPTHPADVGTDNFEQEFTLGLLESERTLLGEINQALERIDSGTFGICVGTGQFIGIPRLRARPWAKYCIEYARMLEKGLVQPGDSRGQADDDEEAAATDEAEAPESDADEEEEFPEEDIEE